MSNLKKAFFILLLTSACKKPTENIKIVVDTNVIKYTALIHVTDKSNLATTPKNATITITGTNADNIYELSGKKQFKLSGGIITIGPGPAVAPTEGSPESCIVQIKAPGYVTVSQPVIFTVDKKQQVVNIPMSKTGVITNAPPVTPTPVYDPVSLNFIGTCNTGSDIEIRPSMYVFFRESGSDSGFQYLGYMDKGNMTVTALAKGKTYDFQLTYDGQSYMVSQQINEPSYDLKVNMGAACNDF